MCLLLVTTALGRHLVYLLPDDFRDKVGFYITPILGLTTIVLITTVYGWVSPFKTGISLALVTALVLLCVFYEKNRTELFQDWLIISLFAIIASLPILAPALRFDSFNPFNDTFTYLVHGQWLQAHSFSEAARSSGFFPAETQVFLYQGAGHRMGGSFFLGFVQSLFSLEWSYYAYLATVSVVFISGCIAIGGIVQQVVPVSRIVALTLSVLPALSVNGFIFGAQYGFFPQTFGLAFAAGLACLVPGLLAAIISSRPSLLKQFIYILPLSLCCSALLITYNDMFPVIGAGIGLFLLVAGGMFWSEKKFIASSVLILLVQVMAVVNIEGVRIVRNFLHTLLGAASGSVHFGWPVLWSPIQFLAHSFGMKSPFGNNVFFIDRLFSTWIFPVLLVGVVAILVKILRSKPKNLVVVFLICINILFWVAFIKFRYLSPSLDGEVGNTFLQFKLSKWLAPYNIALLGIAIAWLWLKGGMVGKVSKIVVLIGLVTGLAVHYVIVAQMYTLHFQDETMQKRSPFNVFLDLRSRVASIPKDQVIYLGIPTEHHKVTQMVAYTLFDRKLAGKYEDGYIRQSIPEGERDMPMDKADWMIQFKPNRTAEENPLDRVGPFLLSKAPFSFYNLESVKGEYSTETGESKTWNWVKDSIEYHFAHIGITPKTKLRFQYLLSGSERVLSLDVNTKTGRKLASFKIQMEEGWGEFESPIIDTDSEDVVIRFTADGDPVQLSPTDSRKTKFLIQNISFG